MQELIDDLYDPVEEYDPEAAIDEEYMEQVRYDLLRNMSTAFVSRFPAGNERMAALSVATHRYDAVRRDIEKARLSFEQVAEIFVQAVRHKVTTPQMAEQQLTMMMQFCPICGAPVHKTAMLDVDEWYLSFECESGMAHLEEVIMPWFFGDRWMSADELRKLGYEIV